MKLIIVLIVLIQVAYGDICKKQNLHFIEENKFYYPGNYKYSDTVDTGQDIQNAIDTNQKNLVFKNIEKGKIYYKEKFLENGRKTKIPHSIAYFSSIVVSSYNESTGLKTCLLELLTIEEFNYLHVRQIMFAYRPCKKKIEKGTDCEKVLRDTLKKELSCYVKDIDKENPIFTIPWYNGLFIKYITETRKFDLNKIRGNQVKIHKDKDKDKPIISVELDNGIQRTFDETDSCFSLAHKIFDLTIKPKQNNCKEENKNTLEFGFNYMMVYKSAKILVVNPKRYAKSRLVLKQGKFTLSDSPMQFTGLSFKEIRDIPAYEGFPLKITLITQSEYNIDIYYLFMPKFETEDCIDNIQKHLSLYHSCPDTGENGLLYYYGGENIQNNDNYLKEFGKIKFEPNGSCIEEDYQHNPIQIYDLKLNQENNQLFIKGVDASGSIVNKFYNVKISMNNFCLSRYESIERHLSEFYFEQGKYFFWTYSNSEDDEIEETGKIESVGVITEIGENILKLESIEVPITFESFEIEGNVLTLKGTANEFGLMKLHLSKCEKCLQRLREELSSQLNADEIVQPLTISTDSNEEMNEEKQYKKGLGVKKFFRAPKDWFTNTFHNVYKVDDKDGPIYVKR
jgi:hypothetical protein